MSGYLGQRAELGLANEEEVVSGGAPLDTTPLPTPEEAESWTLTLLGGHLGLLNTWMPSKPTLAAPLPPCYTPFAWVHPFLLLPPVLFSWDPAPYAAPKIGVPQDLWSPERERFLLAKIPPVFLPSCSQPESQYP